eukprot:6487186-Amphidinium_carterae.1
MQWNLESLRIHTINQYNSIHKQSKRSAQERPSKYKEFALTTLQAAQTWSSKISRLYRHVARTQDA